MGAADALSSTRLTFTDQVKLAVTLSVIYVA